MKTKFSKPSDIKNFSGWSGQYCSLCGKTITNAAEKWSLVKYKKRLCKYCQTLEDYLTKAVN